MPKWRYSSFPWVDGGADGGWAALTIRPVPAQGQERDTRPTVGAITSWYQTEDAWLTNIGFKKGIREDASDLNIAAGDMNNAISEMTVRTLPGEDPQGKEYYVPVLIRESIELTYIIRGALEKLNDVNLLGPLENVPIGSISTLKQIYETFIDGRRAIDILIEEMENMSETSAGQAERDKELQAAAAPTQGGPAPATPRSDNAEFYGLDNTLPPDRKKGSGAAFSEATLRLKKTYPLCIGYDPLYPYSDNRNDEISQQPYGLNLMGNYVGYFESELNFSNIFTREEIQRLGADRLYDDDQRQIVLMGYLDGGSDFASDKGYRGRVDVSSRTISLATLVSYYPTEEGGDPPQSTGPILAALNYPGTGSPAKSRAILDSLSQTQRTYSVRFKYFNTLAYNNIVKFIRSEHSKFLKAQMDEARKRPPPSAVSQQVRPASAVMSGARATTKPKKEGDPARDAAVRILNSQLLLLRNLRNLMPVTTLTHYQKAGLFGNSNYKRLGFKHLINYYGEPEAVIPLVNNPLTGLESFINASNAELSTLVPKLTFYIGDKSGKRRKIEFPDHVHDYQIKALAKAKSSSQIKDMLRGRRNHGTEAGVKSFSWDFDQIHEGDYAVKANLSLFFGSALDLMNDDYKAFLYTTGRPNANSPIIKRGRFKKETKAQKVKRMTEILQEREKKLRDRNLNPPREEEGDSVTRTNRASKKTSADAPELGLYVRVGWAVPKGNMPSNVTEGFKTTIKKTQREIKLNLSGHDISYTPNGQLTLNLKYVGSIGNALDHLSRSDILRTNNSPNDVDFTEYYIPSIVTPVPEDTLDPEISRLDAVSYAKAAWHSGYIRRKAIKKYQSTKENPSPTYSGEDIQPAVPLAKAGVEYELRTLDALLQTMTEKISLLPKGRQEEVRQDPALLRDMEAFQRFRRVAQIALDNVNEAIREPKYASILERLLQEGKIYYGRIIPRSDSLPANAFGKVVSGNYSSATAGSTRSNYDIVFTKKLPKSKTETPAARRKRIKEALSQAYRTGQSPALTLNPREGVSIRDFDLDYGSRNLYYIRLGDLIDNILDNLDNPEDGNDDFYKIVLGSIRPIEHGIPGFSKTDVFMMADIPISIEYFGQFFIETVVAPQRDSLSLKEFLDSLQRKLLAPMFREFSESQGEKSTPIFNTTPLFSGVDLGKGEIIDLNELRDLAFDREQSNLAKSKYLVISPRTLTFNNRRGIESEDIKSGIYHLKIGTDRGIVKSFSASEMNLTKFHRAMQVERSNKPDGFLVVPQNFDLTLVGNQFFPNGATVYIDADVGFGREISQTLGIGGYYGVVKSSHKVEGGTFETVLSCKWLSSGNRDGI